MKGISSGLVVKHKQYFFSKTLIPCQGFCVAHDQTAGVHLMHVKQLVCYQYIDDDYKTTF